MTDRTETTVMTPMITPRRVRPDRSLCRRRASTTMGNSSRYRIAGSGRAGPLGVERLLLLLGHHRDAIAVLDRPQGLEGTRDDLLTRLHAVPYLDRQLAGQARPDLREARLAVLQEIDAFFRLHLAGLRLLRLRRVADDD